MYEKLHRQNPRKKKGQGVLDHHSPESTSSYAVQRSSRSGWSRSVTRTSSASSKRYLGTLWTTLSNMPPNPILSPFFLSSMNRFHRSRDDDDDEDDAVADCCCCCCCRRESLVRSSAESRASDPEKFATKSEYCLRNGTIGSNALPSLAGAAIDEQPERGSSGGRTRRVAGAEGSDDLVSSSSSGKLLLSLSSLIWSGISCSRVTSMTWDKLRTSTKLLKTSLISRRLRIGGRDSQPGTAVGRGVDDGASGGGGDEFGSTR